MAELLNVRNDDPRLVAFVQSLGGRQRMRTVEYLGFFEFKARGMAVMLKKEEWLVPTGASFDPKAFRVEAIHVYAEGFEGYKQYQNPLVGGVTFSDDREQVRARLGNPSDSGGGKVGSFGKRWPEWDRYDFNDHAIYFQYEAEGRKVNMVTVALPAAQRKQ